MAVIRESPVSVREEQGAAAPSQKRSLWSRLFSGKARPIRFFLVGQTATLTQLCVLYALTSWAGCRGRERRRADSLVAGQLLPERYLHLA